MVAPSHPEFLVIADLDKMDEAAGEDNLTADSRGSTQIKISADPWISAVKLR